MTGNITSDHFSKLLHGSDHLDPIISLHIRSNNFRTRSDQIYLDPIISGPVQTDQSTCYIHFGDRFEYLLVKSEYIYIYSINPFSALRSGHFYILLISYSLNMMVSFYCYIVIFSFDYLTYFANSIRLDQITFSLIPSGDRDCPVPVLLGLHPAPLPLPVHHLRVPVPHCVSGWHDCPNLFRLFHPCGRS